MFSKITPKQLRKDLLFKYLFQFFITPIILGSILLFVLLVIDIIRIGVNQACYELFVEGPWWLGIYGFAFFCTITSNILSIIPFVKVLIDNTEKMEQRMVENIQVYPSFEIHGIRKSKAFVCDTFSKKKQRELALFTRENGKRKKYRLFLDEKWGDIKKFEDIVWRNNPLKITYFKHSKVIVAIEENMDWCD